MARFFTAARKVPIVFGKLPGGGHIWGGPYTAAQMITGLACGALAGFSSTFGGFNPHGLWSAGTIFSDIIIVIAVALAAVFLVRFAPNKRNLAFLLWDIYSAFTKPKTGTVEGVEVKATSTSTATHHFRVYGDQSEQAQAAGFEYATNHRIADPVGFSSDYARHVQHLAADTAATPHTVAQRARAHADTSTSRSTP